MKYIKLFENYYTAFDEEDDVLPKEVLNKIKEKMGFTTFKRLGSGGYGTAFKVGANLVLKITRDISEYRYAKKISGKMLKHVANVFGVFHFKYDYEDYALITKELCKTDANYYDNKLEKFFLNTGKEYSISWMCYKFLENEITKKDLDNYFKKYYSVVEKDWFSEQLYDMIMELKKHKIIIKDLNGANLGLNKNGDLCLIEIGFYYSKTTLNKKDKYEIY